MNRKENKQAPKTDTPLTLGGCIRTAREAQGLSARVLAARVHMHPSYVSMLEAGIRRPSPEKLYRFAEALDLNYDDLCGLAGYQAPGLPSLVPYLRARYNIPDEAVASAAEHFEQLRIKHGITERHVLKDTDVAEPIRDFISWTDL